MIDCSLPDLALQGGAQSAPQSGNKASNRADEAAQNFSKFVENKPASHDEAQATDNDETRVNEEESAQDPVDSKWMSHLLYLTQMAQQSEQAETSTDFSLANSVEAEDAAELEFNGKIPVEANLDEGEAGSALTKTPLDKATSTDAGKQAKSGDKENSAQDQAKPESEKLKTALATQSTSETSKSSATPTAQNAALAGQASSGSEAASSQTQSGGRDFSHLIMPGQKGAENIEIGDKIALKNVATTPTLREGASVGAIEGVDIIRTRKQGDLNVLQLQLRPDNLGEVEAKLRLNKDHLTVELSAAKPETAKLLAKDQHLLMQTLEKAGFGSDARLSVSIIERSGAAIQPVLGSSSLQAGAQSMAGNHEGGQNGRQFAEADSGFSSPERDKNPHQPQDDLSHKKSGLNSNTSSLERPLNAFGSSRRLIV